MKSYTDLRNLVGKIVGFSDATSLALVDEFLNDGHRLALGSESWPFLERTATATTVASQQAYNLPYNFNQLINVTITVGNYIYTPREVPSRIMWDKINLASGITSTIPQYYFIFNGQLSFWPTPSASSNTITYTYKVLVKDLSIADYTTGTIVTATNGSSSITGALTSWTAGMAGMWLRITPGTGASLGDGFWYETSAIGSTTGLTLVRNYGGTSIAAGAASYTLGQMPLLPETYHTLPVYYAAAEFLDQLDQPRAGNYMKKYEAKLLQMHDEYSSTSNTAVIDPGLGQPTLTNPNLLIQL